MAGRPVERRGEYRASLRKVSGPGLLRAVSAKKVVLSGLSVEERDYLMPAADCGWREEARMRARSTLICGAVAVAALVSPGMATAASSLSAGANVRVTVDNGTSGAYQSTD